MSGHDPHKGHAWTWDRNFRSLSKWNYSPRCVCVYCAYVEVKIVTASTKGFTWFWSLIIFSPMHNFISFHFDFRIQKPCSRNSCWFKIQEQVFYIQHLFRWILNSKCRTCTSECQTLVWIPTIQQDLKNISHCETKKFMNKMPFQNL